jgi:hypothetical protein
MTAETLSDGQFRVRLTPTALLRSNVTYTLAISDAITDRSGNKITVAVTTNFTTVDYTEPRIIGTDPSTAQAIDRHAFPADAPRDHDIARVRVRNPGGVAKAVAVMTGRV